MSTLYNATPTADKEFAATFIIGRHQTIVEVIMPRKPISVLVAVVCLMAICARADAPPADLQKENAELRKEVARLKSEMAKLRDEVVVMDRDRQLKAQEDLKKQMKPRIEETLPLMPNSQQPLSPPSLKTLPPGTQERQFDGEPFYIIPIAK